MFRLIQLDVGLVDVCLQKHIQVQLWQRLLPIGETAVVRTVKGEGCAAFSREHGEEMLHQLTQVAVRGLVAFSLLLDELSFWVDSKYFGFRYSNLLISISIISPVAEGRVERLPLWVEQVSDVTKTSNFKYLWLLLNHLSVKSGKEAAGSQQDRAFREDSAFVIDPLQVVFSDSSHTYSSR